MKRLFLTLLLCLLIFCGIADARMLQGVAGAILVSGSCPCATSRNSCAGTDSVNMPFCYYADRIYISQQFTASASAKICKAVVRLKKDGDTGNNPTLTAYIYTDSSNAAGSVVGTGSTNTVNVNSLTTSYADVSFTGMNADIVALTKYHFVIGSSAQCTTDLVRLGAVDSGCGVGTDYLGYGDATPTFTAQNTAISLELTLYSCE